MFVAVVVLLCIVPSTVVAVCQYKLPVYGNSAQCANFDLNSIEALPGQNFSTSPDGPMAGIVYLIKVCQNVEFSGVPDICANKPGYPAYQFDNTGFCYPLGKLDDVFVYPVDPTNTSAGIRIAYTNGEGGDPWPRAVFFDLYCDPLAQGRSPTTIYEWPSYTYKVIWHTPAACPSISQGSCAWPKFDATWDSLRLRSRPSWFNDVKFGIFIHWGMFSVPAFKNEWYWNNLMQGNPDVVPFHNRVYGCSGVQPDKFPCNGPSFKFPDFAPMFKADLYDPDHWADVFLKSGAKYVVLTSKHHEGWCNFPSAQHWNWNSVDAGPNMDLVGNLTASVRAKGLHMGLYHSLREWYNPLYIQDNDDNCSTTSFPDEILLPTLKDMVTRYQPEVIWADGAGDAPCTRDSVKYWKAPNFLSWLYNESPVRQTVVANSRWGNDAIGDYSTGGDRFSPGEVLAYKWESCFTIQKSSWGYDRTEGAAKFLSTQKLLMQLVSTVSCNGNLLLNVGPMSDGTLDPVFEERLLEMGAWLEVNGEAIYNTVPWKYQNDTPAQDIWYTTTKDSSSVYAISFRAPTPGKEFVLLHPRPTNGSTITLLGFSNTSLHFQVSSDALHIAIPTTVSFATLSGKNAWTFKMTHVSYR